MLKCLQRRGLINQPNRLISRKIGKGPQPAKIIVQCGAFDQ